MAWEEFISLENIYAAWKNFVRGKGNKRGVIEFEADLENQLYRLHLELRGGCYRHGGYERFLVYDPKKRVIHKASVRDRLVHRLLYDYLLTVFDRQWLACSFSCRPGFGQFRSIAAVEKALRKITHNYTRTAWVVKCDIKKFFDHIDQAILYRLLCRRVNNANILALLSQVIGSFSVTPGCGIPIGNLTSQIFANVYLHGLDLFAKHQLKKRHYFRYADDALCAVTDKGEAEQFIESIRGYAGKALRLKLHPRKTIIRSAGWGIDWLGEVLLPGYKVLRPSTRRWLVKKIAGAVSLGVDSRTITGMMASYRGLLQPVASKQIDTAVRQTVALYFPV